MDDMIATALRERAEGDIHVERLLDAVRTGVRRQRRRRFAVGFGAAAAVVALVAAAGVATAPDRRPDGRTAQPAQSGRVPLPRPPAVAGAPTAADRPEVLGSGSGLFHLDIRGTPIGWRNASWASTRGFEELGFEAAETGGDVRVLAARDPIWLGELGPGAASAAVDGLPAETVEQGGAHVVRWQPRAGIWAQVWATGEPDSAIAVAGKLRFDRVYRCAVPFRLAGYAEPALNKCSTDFVLDEDGLSATAAGTVWLTPVTGGPEYQVSVGRGRTDTVLNDTIAGRAVQVKPGATAPAPPPEIRYPFDGRTAYFWRFGDGPEEAFRALVAAFTPVPGPDPNDWPATAFGS